MHEPFSCSRAKIARAEQHRKGIEPEIKALAESNPLTLSSKHNLKGTQEPVRFRYTVAKIAPIPEHWGLVVGDAVQNLRAALDHAVWALVVKEKGAKFAEANAPKIDFPIADDPTRFPKRRLGDIGIHPKFIAVIEQTQPYRRNQSAPRHDPLWILRALSNVDKHRLLHVIVVIPENCTVKTTPFLPNGKIELLIEGPLHEGAEAMRFTASRPATKGNVQVELEFRASICIAATPQSLPVPIDLGLRDMRDRVIEVIDALAEASRGKRPRKSRSA